MPDTLDLDALLPQPKKVKISGKVIDCYPPKVRQTIAMQLVWEKIQSASSPEEAEQMLLQVLSPIVPAIKDDPTIDFTLEQLKTLLLFAQNLAIPEGEAASTPQPTEQKKTDSPA